MYRIVVKKYRNSIPIDREAWNLEAWNIDAEGEKQVRQFSKIPCEVVVCHNQKEQTNLFDIQVKALQTPDAPISVTLEYSEEEWQRTEYVFVPAAVYNGNKQESLKLPYPPYYGKKDEQGWHQVITDIPRLQVDTSHSKLQLLAGDMSTPAIGYFSKERKEGVLLFAPHRLNDHYTGFTIEEKKDCANFCIMSPGVREKEKYFFGELHPNAGFYPTCEAPSDDIGIVLQKGETLDLSVQAVRFTANSLADYFRTFNKLRENMESGTPDNSLPFATAYEAVKDKYLRMNFDEEEGYICVGSERKSAFAYWQAGWVGGGMNTYPFLLAEKGKAYEEAVATIAFIINHLQYENGWYVPLYANGKSYGDDFEHQNEPILLVRKDADLLYFMLKQAFYFRKHHALPVGMDDSMKRQADAFVRVVQKNGQLGQFLNLETEELVAGDTASAAIAPAALALAYEYFGKPEYLATAEKLGNLYWEDYLKKGLLNGGPGEICQAADSESAFGFLEACVQLYETTGKEPWLDAAKEAFELAITWVVSYDFCFPSSSTAAQIGAHTQGTVFANAQNKHSAPGICTMSGNSMLKLYRFTGDEKYLKWLQRISHALSQFVSLEERPIQTLSNKPLLPGYFNERVQMSDWEGKETVGEFLYGSNWPETSMLLTFVEVPGIYLDLDRQVMRCNDHIAAHIVEEDGETIKLELSNTTVYDTTVTVWIDHSLRPLKNRSYYEEMVKIPLKAGETKLETIDSHFLVVQ